MSEDLLGRIARKAAEAAVTVCYGNDLRVGPWLACCHGDEADDARADADEARRCLAPLFLAACEDALRSCPVPPSIGEERLAEIRGAADPKVQVTPQGWATSEEEAVMLRDLLAELDHCRALFRSPEGEGLALAHEAGRRQGFALGAAQQHEADVAAAAHRPPGCDCVLAVRDAPLVAYDEGRTPRGG